MFKTNTMIGKQVYHKETLEEFEVDFVEIIEDTTIVYTTDNKSFNIDELTITPYQSLVDEYGSDNLKKFFRTQFKPIPHKVLEKLINGKTKTKTFKIFGWAITFTKSK